MGGKQTDSFHRVFRDLVPSYQIDVGLRITALPSLVLPLDRADEIIISPQLAAKWDQPGDLKREAEAFRTISSALVVDPTSAIDCFLKAAMDLCGGDAAGLSLPKNDGQSPQFEWTALAGVYAAFIGGRVPLNDSPCGLARRKSQAIVVSQPGRVFPEFAGVDPQISEGLIVPFYDTSGEFLGTIWVVHTTSDKHFSLNDVRVMESLAIQMVLALKLSREQSSIRHLRQVIDGASDDGSGPTSSALDRNAADGWSEGAALHLDLADFVEANAFRESVLASSGDCIKVLDLDGRLLFMNRGGTGLMEVSDPASVLGLDWPATWKGAAALLARDGFDTACRGTAARFRGDAATFAGTMKHWDVQLMPIKDRDGRVSQVLVSSRDITEQKRIEEQRELLAGELNHRVKNILAMVVAIAHQTLRAPATIESAAEAFTDRIAALGEAQSLLTSSTWNSADIGVVIAVALAPHRSSEDQFVVGGPSIELEPSRALSLALATHELATNAAKYGALSRDGGRVQVKWDIVPAEDGDHLSLEWREEGGPTVVSPKARGFGTRLIERALAAEFRGNVRIDFEDQGVICRLLAPMKGLSATATA